MKIPTIQKIRLSRISHVYYTHKDIEKAWQFLADFGLSECKRVGKRTYYRGYSSEPFVYCAEEGDEDAFGGVAFAAESLEDLRLASQSIPGASDIYEMSDAPGGGQCVTFYDPVDRFPFHIVHGQRQLERQDVVLPHLEFNFVSLESQAAHCCLKMLTGCSQPVVKNRQGGHYQRFEKRTPATFY